MFFVHGVLQGLMFLCWGGPVLSQISPPCKLVVVCNCEWVYLTAGFTRIWCILPKSLLLQLAHPDLQMAAAIICIMDGEGFNTSLTHFLLTHPLAKLRIPCFRFLWFSITRAKYIVHFHFVAAILSLSSRNVVFIKMGESLNFMNIHTYRDSLEGVLK
jgi:hypothetical protein